MARNDTGRWVARAAATGGGRTYRGQRPLKWYFTLFLICVVGVALIVYSRYELQHPASAGPPTVGDSWYAAYHVDICGVSEPALSAPSNVTTSGITTSGSGLIHIAPKSSADSGANATLGRFVTLYRGMKLNSTTIRYPAATGSTAKRTFTLGNTCPKGTPDAGKHGEIIVRQWSDPSGNPSNIGKAKPTTVGNPSALRLQDGQLLSIGFVPAGTVLGKPPATEIQALLQAIVAAQSGTTGSTTPSLPLTPSTTAPATGKPSSGTTTPASPSTTAPATGKPSSGTTTKP